MPVAQHFVKNMTELPAEHRAAGQREAERVGPEGVGSLLSVGAQDDSCEHKLRSTNTKAPWRGPFMLIKLYLAISELSFCINTTCFSLIVIK